MSSEQVALDDFPIGILPESVLINGVQLSAQESGNLDAQGLLESSFKSCRMRSILLTKY